MNLPEIYDGLLKEHRAHIDALELQAVLCEDGDCSAGVSPDEANMFSVYIHYRHGNELGLYGVQCIADFATYDEAVAYGMETSRANGLDFFDFA